MLDTSLQVWVERRNKSRDVDPLFELLTEPILIITSEPVDVSKVTSKINSLDNASFVPGPSVHLSALSLPLTGGGAVQIFSEPLPHGSPTPQHKFAKMQIDAAKNPARFMSTRQVLPTRTSPNKK